MPRSRRYLADDRLPLLPGRRLLVEAAYPEVRETSLLPSPPPTDPGERLQLTMNAFIDQVTPLAR